MQLLSRTSELSDARPGDTGIFHLAVITAAARIRPDSRCKEQKGLNRPGRIVGRTRASTPDLLEIILATLQARATPGIAKKESANIRRGISIISDNGGEVRLAKAWFIARIRDLNCRATRGADGTRIIRRNLLSLPKNLWWSLEIIKELFKTI